MSQGSRVCQKIEVTDLELNKKTIYHAIRVAARELNISRRYIENFIHLNQTEPVMGRYLFKKIGEPEHKIVGIQANCKKLEVTDVKLNKVTLYPSISQAAKELGIRQTSISTYLSEDNRQSPFRGIYLFKLID